MVIKAIETNYAGCRFRSRLEARWAVFFDHLGIPWQYEPQGFELPSGRYLPDFLLPEINKAGVWFEVKNEEADSSDLRWSEMAERSEQELIVAFGMPRAGKFRSRRDDGWMVTYGSSDHPGWDLDRWFCICKICGKVGIQFASEWMRICWHTFDESETTEEIHPRIIAGYTAAQSARFEHGESGGPAQSEPIMSVGTSVQHSGFEISALLGKLFNTDTARRYIAWCGMCDSARTRHIGLSDDGRMARCPRCHPLRSTL